MDYISMPEKHDCTRARGEVSIRFERIENLESTLLASEISRLPLPWESAFLGQNANPIPP